MSKPRRYAALIFLLSISPLYAELKLPKVFSDHMVLQRDLPIRVWGWADAGEKVSVEFGGQKQSGVADASGRWEVKLPPRAATATAQTLTARCGGAAVAVEDVLVGDVWLCAGQSNMDYTLNASDGGPAASASAGQLNQIRLLRITAPGSGIPAHDIPNTWTQCTLPTAGAFSAVGFYFGKAVQEKIGVPIGLIQASWPGTMIQPWTPKNALASDEKLKPALAEIEKADQAFASSLQAKLPEVEAWTSAARKALQTGAELPPMPAWPTHPLLSDPNPRKETVLFNSRILPLIPFGLRGVIWYQGESNKGDGPLYANRLRALIRGWRELWSEGDFPFYFVQLAPLGSGYGPNQLVDLWQAQSACLDVPNTGMAVTNDIGDLNTIHPKNKRDVGERLARIALAKTYRIAGIADSGPVFRSVAADGSRLRVAFDFAEGLRSRDGQPLTWFEIAGSDGNFTRADAVISGSEVVVSSSQVPAPKVVRFAWANHATPNLTNAAALPSPAFQAEIK